MIPPGSDGRLPSYLTGERTPIQIHSPVRHCRFDKPPRAAHLTRRWKVSLVCATAWSSSARLTGADRPGASLAGALEQHLAPDPGGYRTPSGNRNTTEGAARRRPAGRCWRGLAGCHAGCRAVIHTVDTTHPVHSAVERYAAAYPLYRSLYPTLRPVFNAVAAS
jgi:hypothetical protein